MKPDPPVTRILMANLLSVSGDYTQNRAPLAIASS